MKQHNDENNAIEVSWILFLGHYEGGEFVFASERSLRIRGIRLPFYGAEHHWTREVSRVKKYSIVRCALGPIFYPMLFGYTVQHTEDNFCVQEDSVLGG